MRKFISLSVALMISAAVFAQENQVKDAVKALKKGNIEAADAALKSANVDVNKLWSYDPEVASDYLFTRARVCEEIGTKDKNYASWANAIKFYDKVVEFEKGVYHRAKNVESGDYDFFESEQAMNDAIAAGTHKKGKSKDIKDFHTKEVATFANNLAVTIHQGAIDAYQAKDFVTSRTLFLEAFEAYSNPLVNKADTTFVYNAAVLASTEEKNDEVAIEIFQRLLDMGYTGVVKVYEATNKESGEKSQFDSKKAMDMQVKLGLYVEPNEYMSENKQASIYRFLALSYGNLGDKIEDEKDETKIGYYHKAVEILEDALAKYPTNQDVLLTLGNFYLKDGNTQGFLDAMKKATIADPNNEMLYYNIGVVSSDLGFKKEAKEALAKAIELKEDYTDAYVMMAYIILDRDQEINDEISALPIKLNAKNRKKLKALEAEKMEVYKSAVGYLEKAYEFNKTNEAVLQTLKNIYYALDRVADFKKMKAELEALQAGQN